LGILERVTLIFRGVKEKVSINEPNQKGTVKDNKNQELKKILIVVVVSDHVKFYDV
jgi:hypothetical protein